MAKPVGPNISEWNIQDKLRTTVAARRTASPATATAVAGRGFKVLAGALCFAGALTSAATGAAAAELVNPFHDPFVQLTSGIPSCPVPLEPRYSSDEFNQAAHERSQRGVSCWLSGRCRLPNAYLYDQEIAPRLQKVVEADGHFNASSVWALVQRRFVWLKGCVHNAQTAQDLRALIENIDDVEQVIDELSTDEVLPK